MARAIVALLVFCFATAARAPAQSLSAQGDRFAIDGVPKFLTFISYFGAMNAANVPALARAAMLASGIRPAKTDVTIAVKIVIRTGVPRRETRARLLGRRPSRATVKKIRL